MGYLSATRPFNFPRFADAEYFTDVERRQVEALFDRLYPSDHANGVPGATDARASRFLSRLLALDEEEYHKITVWREAYRNGLILLDASAQVSFGKKLTDLLVDQIDDFLGKLELGSAEGLPDDFDQRSFFRLLQEHCIKGCFADPRWGGNEDGIMWRWLGWVQPAEDIKFGEPT